MNARNLRVVPKPEGAAAMSDEALLELSSRPPDDYRARLGVDHDAPGWVTDGVWAFLLGRAPKYADLWWPEGNGALSELVRVCTEAKHTPMRERTDLEMPPHVGPCRNCGGSGRLQYWVENPDGTESPIEAECDWCDGEKDVQDFKGQCVFEDESGLMTILDPKLRCLFDTLAVARIEGTQPGELNCQPLGGFCKDCGLVAIVMPIRGVVRTR